MKAFNYMTGDELLSVSLLDGSLPVNDDTEVAVYVNTLIYDSRSRILFTSLHS